MAEQLPSEPSNHDSAEPSFEQALNRLQDIVEQLERGDLPLERALSVFEEGVRLSRRATRCLDEAEQRVELLLAEGDRLETRPLDEREPTNP